MAEPTLTLKLTDTDWHAVGLPEDNWSLECISGSAVDVVSLPVGITPTATTKAYFIIGGMLNRIRTRLNFQAWARAHNASPEAPVTIIQHDDDNEGFDETSHLRAMILALQGKVAWLTGHALEQDIWRAGIIEDWDLLKFTLTDRMDRITLSIARLADMDVTMIDQIRLVRQKIPAIMGRLNALEETRATEDDVNQAIHEIFLAIAKNTNLSVELLERFLSLDFQISKCRKQINELSAFGSKSPGSTGGGTGTATLQLELKTLQDNLDLYWALCIKIVNLPTVAQIKATYAEFVSTNVVSEEMMATLEFVRDQAIAIIENTIIDTAQETDINTIEEVISAPSVPKAMSAAELKQLLMNRG